MDELTRVLASDEDPPHEHQSTCTRLPAPPPLACTSPEESTSAEALLARYREVYADEPLVRVVDEIPVVRDAMQRHVVTVGGVQVDEAGEHAVILVTLDNLLKGR